MLSADVREKKSKGTNICPEGWSGSSKQSEESISSVNQGPREECNGALQHSVIYRSVIQAETTAGSVTSSVLCMLPFLTFRPYFNTFAYCALAADFLRWPQWKRVVFNMWKFLKIATIEIYCTLKPLRNINPCTATCGCYSMTSCGTILQMISEWTTESRKKNIQTEQSSAAKCSDNGFISDRYFVLCM